MKVKTHRRKSSHRRRNPASSHRRKSSHRRRRHNPGPSKVGTRRRRHTRRRHNPSGKFMDLVIQGLGAGTGIGLGTIANSYAAKWLPVKYRGVASLTLGAVAALTLGRKYKAAQAAGVAAIGTGVWDLLRQNISALTAFSAEDAAYLLGSASASDPSIAPEMAAIFGAANADVPGVLPNVFGAANADVPGVLPNVFGVDTGIVPLGVDTGSVPLGMFGEEEGESLFGESYL